jgi:hypothetical protein
MLNFDVKLKKNCFINTFIKYSKGCINDIRINGRYLSMENGTEIASVSEWHNVIDGCQSNNPCQSVICQQPFVCVDIWLMHKCRSDLFLFFMPLITTIN